MRKAVKVLANFLGAAKELTSEYVDLAEITDDEQNQIRMSLTSRPDRKQAVKLLASKGLKTSVIAEQTGWPERTIRRDLAEIEAARQAAERRTNVREERTNVRPSATGSAETKQHRAEVAAVGRSRREDAAA